MSVFRLITNPVVSVAKFLFRHKLLLVLTLICLAVAGYFIHKKISPSPVAYSVVSPQVKDIRQTLDISGSVVAGSQVVLRFQAGGKLAWVGVKEGDTVKKYQSIASLDKSTLKKQLQKYLNLYQTNRWTFEQNRDDQNVTNNQLDTFSLSDSVKRSLEQDQFSLNNAVLDVEIQDLANQLATIYSPIDGIVVSAPTQVAPLNILYTDAWTIIDPNSLYFEAEVDETDLSLVHQNQSAEITLDAFPETAIESNLFYINFNSSLSDSGGTVYKIKLSLIPGKVNYRLGLNGDASILISEKQSVLTVPLESIIQRDSQTYVKVLKNGQPQEIPIKTGIKDQDNVEVIEGLSTADQVVLPK